MYDQVTLGLNVDPFILSALKEDITSEDCIRMQQKLMNVRVRCVAAP